jgi:hypothetical protein
VRRAVEQLLTTHQLTSDTYDRLTEKLGQRGVFELLALCGYYVLLAMVMNSLEITRRS